MEEIHNDMKTLISVIIPKTENNIYLARCLNSIKRQTYENIEIIAIEDNAVMDIYQKHNVKLVSAENDIDEWNKSIALAKGEYIFFCNSTSILPRNIISDLQKEAEKTEGAVSATFRSANGEKFTPYLKTELSIYGKLLNAKHIREKKIIFAKGGCKEALFILQYIKEISRVFVVKTAEIYETDSTFFEKALKIESKLEDIQTVLSLLEHIPLTTKKDFVVELINNLELNASPDTKLKAIANVSDFLISEKELNFQLAQKHVKEYYEQLIENENAQAYTFIQTYLSKFEFENQYLKVMLDVLGISTEQYEIMQKGDLKSYLFYFDKLPNHKKEEAYRISIEERVEKLERVVANYNISASVNENILHDNVKTLDFTLDNATFADEIITRYATGNLGLKTILKATKAWLKFKF